MRRLAYIVISFVSIQVLAEGEFKFACVTGIPSTTFSVAQNKEFLNVAVIHHHGLELMPIFNGVLTRRDIPELQRQSDSMAKLGQKMQVNFPMNKCSFYGEGVFTCYHGDKIKIDGDEYDIFAIHSTLSAVKGQGYEFQHRTLTLSVYVNNKRQQISMDYEVEDCSFENEPPAQPLKKAPK